MMMFDPPHPGEFIFDTYIEPFELSARSVAKQLDVNPSTFGRLLKKQSAVTPEMALRLAKVLGRSPESWLSMQDQYDLFQAKKVVNLTQVKALDFSKLEAVVI